MPKVKASNLSRAAANAGQKYMSARVLVATDPMELVANVTVQRVVQSTRLRFSRLSAIKRFAALLSPAAPI